MGSLLRELLKFTSHNAISKAFKEGRVVVVQLNLLFMHTVKPSHKQIARSYVWYISTYCIRANTQFIPKFRHAQYYTQILDFLLLHV